MIQAIGTDAVEVERFAVWISYPQERLRRIYTPSELEYSFSVWAICAQRLALRFAVKEAFFKALSTFAGPHGMPFLTMVRHIGVEKTPQGALFLQVKWAALKEAGIAVDENRLRIHVSATHTKTTAFACVILEQIE